MLILLLLFFLRLEAIVIISSGQPLNSPYITYRDLSTRQDRQSSTNEDTRSLHWNQLTCQFEISRSYSNSIRFPPNGFKRYFTLFSKFFSPFPHGTCLLSVSCPYLALDEVYHPIRAALPSNSTRRGRIARKNRPRSFTGLSPSLVPYSKEFRSWVFPDCAPLGYSSVNNIYWF